MNFANPYICLLHSLSTVISAAFNRRTAGHPASLFFCSSFRRKPESIVFALCSSFPRRRESCSCFCLFRFSLKAKASTRLRRAGSFLCSCKERNQRNTPQRLAPFGHPARKVRVSGRVPLIAHSVQQRNRRDPSRRPCGPFRPLPPQGHGSPGRAKRARPARRSEKRKAEAKPLLLLSLLLILGPVSRGEGRPESPDKVARRDAREFANGQDAHRANPGPTLRTAAGGAAPGVCSLWLLSLAQARESDPLARMRAEKRRDAPSSKIKSKDTGFRLPPE